MGEHEIWNKDDLTVFARSTYLNYYIPLFLLFVNLVFFILNISRYILLKLKGRFKWETSNEFDRDWNKHGVLKKRDTVPNHIPYVGTNYNSKVLSSPFDSTDYSVDSVKDRHFDIDYIAKEVLENNKITLNIVHRKFRDKLRIIIEFLLVTINTIIHTHILLNSDLNITGELTLREYMVFFALWFSLFIIITLRLINMNESVNWICTLIGDLWLLSFSNYSILLIIGTASYRSVLIGSIKTHVDKIYHTQQFYINLILFSILLFSPIQNSLPLLYKTRDDITPSPEPLSSIANYISFSWLNPLISKCKRSNLLLSDVWALTYDDYCSHVMQNFKEKWSTKVYSNSFSIRFALSLKYFLLIQIIWSIAASFITFVPIIFLQKFLEYIDNPMTTSKNVAVLYVIGMFISKVIVLTCQGQINHIGRRMSIRMNSILISEIYFKVLRKVSISASTSQGSDRQDSGLIYDEEISPKGDGAILNLMSVDVSNVLQICEYLHLLIGSIIMIIVSLSMLVRLLGTAAFVGLCVLLLIFPLNVFLARSTSRFQHEGLLVTDKRIQNLNELFSSIKIIKCFTWEDNFINHILRTRDSEVRKMKLISVIWSCNAIIWYLTPTLITSISFAYFIFCERATLTAPIAFTALSLFGLLKMPLDQLSSTINYIVQSVISLRRIQSFLDEPDMDKQKNLLLSKDGTYFMFSGATIGWSINNKGFILENLNVKFKSKKLNVVAGPTGAGKSLLLMSLLGETHLFKGEIHVPSLASKHELMIHGDGLTNSISYCSQIPWIINDSIKNNILFGSEFNLKRYNDVIRACCLTNDLRLLQDGDNSIVGDRGQNLSGGQRQRVSLARAIYSKSMHIILDDCLSAVDSKCAKDIYDLCLTGPLMKGRTCILVSHNVELVIKKAAYLLILDNRTTAYKGPPGDLLKDKALRQRYCKFDFNELNENCPNQCTTSVVHKPDYYLEDRDSSSKTQSQTILKNLDDQNENILGEVVPNGAVDLYLYKWYFKYLGGWKVLSLMLSSFLLAQFGYFAQSWWVRNWLINRSEVSNFSFLKSNKNSDTNDKYYFFMYFFIGLCYALFSSIKSGLTYFTGINACNRIFIKILRNVVSSKLIFFEKTPIGSIMNNFSKDIRSLDFELSPFIEGTFSCTLQTLMSLILITYVNPNFIFPAIFIFLFCCFIGHSYLCCSRELKRYESITKTPIYQHFSESLAGLVSIRAFGDELRFIKVIFTRVDEYNKSFFYLWEANNWLSFRIELIGSITILATGLFLLSNANMVDSGLAGITFTYAIAFTESALWMIKFYATMEMNMNSVERLYEYTNLEQEPYSRCITNVDNQWPNSGDIKFKNVTLRYSPELPKVLQDVTFVIGDKEKIGVVGRTGAGK
ncbi:hypothetical protein Kpol_175p1, partial [Vanderwaltozyma polyspora DSM 70294]